MDPIQVWPVTRDAIPAGPVALVAIKVRPPAVSARLSWSPSPIEFGAALFSRGPETYVVFDEGGPSISRGYATIRCSAPSLVTIIRMRPHPSDPPAGNSSSSSRRLGMAASRSFPPNAKTDGASFRSDH